MFHSSYQMYTVCTCGRLVIIHYYVVLLRKSKMWQGKLLTYFLIAKCIIEYQAMIHRSGDIIDDYEIRPLEQYVTGEVTSSYIIIINYKYRSFAGYQWFINDVLIDSWVFEISFKIP